MSETTTQRGHIIRAELEKQDDEYGVVFVIWPVGKEKGYGILYGERHFIPFTSPHLATFLSDINRPVFDRHHDLDGAEVEMTFLNDKLIQVSVVQEGAKRIYPESDAERNSREKTQSINKEGDSGVRGRRFYACRAAASMQEVINALPIPDARKNELLNLSTVLQRMVIAENDGELSQTRLQTF